MKNIKYKIHFGEKAFSVNEWLYNYFNEVKEKPQLYNQLFNVMAGTMKKDIIVIAILLLSLGLKAQTITINRQTYYTSQSVDTLLYKRDTAFANTTARFVAQLTTLTNRVAILEGKATVSNTRQDQQQVVINQTVTRVNGHDTVLAKLKPTWVNPPDFLLIQGTAMDSLYLRNQIIPK